VRIGLSHRWPLVAAAAGLSAFALAGAGWLHFRAQLEPAASGGATAIFTIEPGASVASVARELEGRNLIRDARAFRLLARLEQSEGSLHVGQYEVSPASGAPEILRTFVEGRVMTHALVVPEGFTAAEIAARLDDQDLCDGEAFLALVRDPASGERFGVEGPTLEGYLFPETYHFPRGLEPEAVVRTMVDEFLAAWTEFALEARNQRRSMHEVVTLASIVEKETGVAEERPRIASVFLNRLGRGMRLESDPTTIYGIPDFDGNLRRVHLEDDANPYNTYRVQGLTPTPIANPGADALRAVLWPEDTEYLFFVSRNDGTHAFARNYTEHNRNVDRFQRRRSQR